LSSLKSLTNLNLGSNQISDISALSGLTNLQTLFLKDNQISDISPLGGLPSLRDVNLEKNPLSIFSVEIYIPLLFIKGASIRSSSEPITPKIIMYTVIVLVAAIITFIITGGIGGFFFTKRRPPLGCAITVWVIVGLVFLFTLLFLIGLSNC
jgi:Leucine-rich repeat (LRR) protein